MLKDALTGGGMSGFGLADRLRRLVRGRDGVALVDFALVLPLLLFLLLGCLEVGRYVLLNQKLSRAAIGTSDLVSQAKHAVVADIDQVFAATLHTMRPFTLGTDGVVVITSVSTDDTLPVTPTISWQMSGGGTAAFASKVGATVGQPANLPAGFTMEENQDIIIAEVFYDYQPFFFGQVVSPKVIRYVGLHHPRLGPLRTLIP
jgi:Flp pilus assembly protein TadG